MNDSENWLNKEAICRVESLLKSDKEENWNLAIEILRKQNLEKIEDKECQKILENIFIVLEEHPKKLNCFLKKNYLLPIKNLENAIFTKQSIENIPDNFWQLSELKNINFYKNQLNEVSPQIGKLKNLEILDLSSNQIKYLPKEIGLLEELHYFSLLKNQLKEIPESIGSLKKLSQFILTRNSLEILPESIGNLICLEVFYVAANPLKKLPESMDKLRRLKKLSFANLKVDFDWSDAFSKISYLPDLELLNLSYNEGVNFPQEIKLLSNIKKITFSHTPLSLEEKKQFKVWLPNTTLVF